MFLLHHVLLLRAQSQQLVGINTLLSFKFIGLHLIDINKIGYVFATYTFEVIKLE